MSQETIFTKIINREIPADIIYEDDLALAFKDINPQAPFHALIIPKQAIATINDVTEENSHLVGHLYVVAAKLAKQLNFSDDGYRVVMNCNEHGGQTVYHIHLHMLAGKEMGWPPYQNTKKLPFSHPLNPVS
ncbi:histidine triad nucleotide-binding protein [Pseudoalteromonas undina]|uniref:histidine triad nucleotide-binding protein n=1 Tax=Pseudoalteromonas undina TaxID=43660 RepID=UPI001867D371|nr:histidine triad nucleotide-binding protein [Pseudoalteromonas undina]